jgi:hypothetical protein
MANSRTGSGEEQQPVTRKFNAARIVPTKRKNDFFGAKIARASAPTLTAGSPSADLDIRELKRTGRPVFGIDNFDMIKKIFVVYPLAWRIIPTSTHYLVEHSGL